SHLLVRLVDFGLQLIEMLPEDRQGSAQLGLHLAHPFENLLWVVVLNARPPPEPGHSHPFRLLGSGFWTFCRAVSASSSSSTREKSLRCPSKTSRASRVWARRAPTSRLSVAAINVRLGPDPDA